MMALNIIIIYIYILYIIIILTKFLNAVIILELNLKLLCVFVNKSLCLSAY